MEFNFKEKFSHCYNSKNLKSSKLVSNSNVIHRNKYSHYDDIQDKSFHLDCRYTRKKVCTCKFYENNKYLSAQSENDFSNFLNLLINDEITLDLNAEDRQIKFLKKDNYSEFNKQKGILEEQRLRNIEYNKARVFLKNTEELNLSIADYKEIEKSINDDKKICENCKTNIYENNFHKGWKNEAGEYVLLCPLCSKKYFNGALEIKFDSYTKKDELISNKNLPMSSGNQIIIKNDGPITAPTKINFQVINTSRPVEDPTLLGNKRFADKEVPELICANKRCLKVGKRNDFISCAKCDKYYHPYCVEPQVVMKYVNRFKWYCATCKICQVCNKIDKNAERLSKCSTCDRTFHQSCHPLTESSINRKLFCADCINCKNCNKVLPVLNAINQNDFLSIKGHRVCEECWNYYKNKHYCPKCLKIYKSQVDIQTPKIYCKKCLNYYHAECEGLTVEDVKERNRMKNDYTCTICKMS